jgi:aspartate aminotransferase
MPPHHPHLPPVSAPSAGPNDAAGAVSCHVRADLAGREPATNLVVNEAARAALARGEKVFHFGFGESPFPVLPRVVDALRQHAARKEYAPVRGVEALRTGIAGFHRRLDNVAADSELVIVGPGSKELIFLAMLCAAEDTVVFLPGPTWCTYAPQAGLAGKRVVRVASREGTWKLDPAALAAALAKHASASMRLVVLEYPDNPTGVSYDASALGKLAAVLRAHDAIAISDEIYGPLTFARGAHTSLAALCPERTILSNGLSKWGGAGGWRIGWHVYPESLANLHGAVVTAASHTYSSAATPIQVAAAAYFDDPQELDFYLESQRAVLAAAGAWCHKRLVAAGLECAVPEGAYYLFPNFEPLRARLAARGIQTGAEVAALVRAETGVVLMASGPDFNMPHCHWTMRLCYVLIDGQRALDVARERMARGDKDKTGGEGSPGCTCELGGDDVEATLRDIAPRMCEGIDRLAAWVAGVL